MYDDPSSKGRHVESGSIDVNALLFDDANEAKFKNHRVSVDEVLEVFEGKPRFYINRPERQATHVMVGPTRGKRMLVIPIEPFGYDVWRPVTAFEARPQQVARYRRRR